MTHAAEYSSEFFKNRQAGAARPRLRHRMTVQFQGSPVQSLGADDLRLEYDVPKTGAANLTTVVLGTQEGTGNNSVAPFVPP